MATKSKKAKIETWDYSINVKSSIEQIHTALINPKDRVIPADGVKDCWKTWKGKSRKYVPEAQVNGISSYEAAGIMNYAKALVRSAKGDLEIHLVQDQVGVKVTTVISHR